MNQGKKLLALHRSHTYRVACHSNHVKQSLTLLLLRSVPQEVFSKAASPLIQEVVGHVVLLPLVLEGQLQVGAVAVKLHPTTLLRLQEDRAATWKAVPCERGLEPCSLLVGQERVT